MQQVREGETIYIGAYGKAEAILAPVPEKRPVLFGVQAHLVTPALAKQLAHLEDPDPEWDAMWERIADERSIVSIRIVLADQSANQG